MIKPKNKWEEKFQWQIFKAECTFEDMTLTWSMKDPWILMIGGKVIEDFPEIKAEDYKLAEYYAEKVKERN